MCFGPWLLFEIAVEIVWSGVRSAQAEGSNRIMTESRRSDRFDHFVCNGRLSV